jgi:hypothetical protein
MKVAAYHSHLNGLEYLLVQKPQLWREVQASLANLRGGLVDKVTSQHTRVCRDSSWLQVELGTEFGQSLQALGWETAVPESLLKERVFVKFALGVIDGGIPAFANHLAFFVGDVIDVGIEIVPMKELQEEMSSGVPYYEGELYNLIREGRGVPAVPLVLVGVIP